MTAEIPDDVVERAWLAFSEERDWPLELQSARLITELVAALEKAARVLKDVDREFEGRCYARDCRIRLDVDEARDEARAILARTRALKLKA